MLETHPLVLRLEQSGVLTDEDRHTLVSLCTEPRLIRAETVLVSQGGEPCDMHLIVDGFAYRYKLLPDGRRQIIGVMLPGDFCDLQAAILRRSDHFLATLTDCAVVLIPQHRVDAMTLAPSSLARALWWSTLVDESVLRQWLANMGQRPADQWLAHFFCELLLRLQVVGRARADACDMPFTQEQLADILGISSVHVNRVLKDLRGRDLLRISRRRAEFPDAARLRAFCAFDPDYLHLRNDLSGTSASGSSRF